MNYYYQIINDSLDTLYYKKNLYLKFIDDCNGILQMTNAFSEKEENLYNLVNKNCIFDEKCFRDGKFKTIKENIGKNISDINEMISISRTRISIINRRIQEEQSE